LYRFSFKGTAFCRAVILLLADLNAYLIEFGPKVAGKRSSEANENRAGPVRSGSGPQGGLGVWGLLTRRPQATTIVFDFIQLVFLLAWPKHHGI